jgi:plasmid stabilization system protein ParE
VLIVIPRPFSSGALSIWSDRAKSEFKNLITYIAAQSPENAQWVANRISKSIDLLSEFQFGQEGPLPGTFRHYIPKTSYFVIYRDTTNTIEIAAFAHTSSDWINWKEDNGVQA